MPPPGYEPFLAAICAHPDDDTPRLVYADWLDENGDPDRAEFIRCQVEAARLSEIDHHDTAYHQRTRELLALHQHEWVNELPGGADLWEHQNAWDRGLPSTVGVSGRGMVFLRHAAMIVRTLPVRSLFATSLYDEQIWDSIANCAELSHFRRVTARTTVRNGGAAALANSPYLVAVEELDLAGCGIADAGGLSLSQSPYLQNVRSINLRWNRFSSEVCAALRGRFGKRVGIKVPR